MKGLDWFKVVSNIAFDDDIEHVSDAAFRTYFELIGVSSFDASDGRVPLDHARKLCNTPDFDAAISELVLQKFVKISSDKVCIPRFKKYQQTSRETRRKREETKERVTRYRERYNGVTNAPRVRVRVREENPPYSPPQERLVSLARDTVPGWVSDPRDEPVIARGIERLGADGTENLILRLSGYVELHPKKYKVPRLALQNWIGREPKQEDTSSAVQDGGYPDIVVPEGWR